MQYRKIDDDRAKTSASTSLWSTTSHRLHDSHCISPSTSTFQAGGGGTFSSQKSSSSSTNATQYTNPRASWPSCPTSRIAVSVDPPRKRMINKPSVANLCLEMI